MFRHNLLAVVPVVLCLLICGEYVQADDGAEFVQQVVDEDQAHVNDYHSMDDKAYEQEFLRQQAAEQERMRKLQEEEQAQMELQNARIRRQREQQLQKEMNKLNEEQRQAFRKQQKKDAKMVQGVLNAAVKDNPYAVLGLWNNRQITILRGRTFSILGKFTIAIPELTIFQLSPSRIKQAYRSRAKATHPDKSKDPRATEAFVAVEHAASLLLDTQARQQYDDRVRQHRQAQIKKYKGMIERVVQTVAGTTTRVIGTIRTLLGPFAVPVLILSVLIF